MLKLESIFLLRHPGGERGMGTTAFLSLSLSLSRNAARQQAEGGKFWGEGGWHGAVAFLGFFVRLGFLGLVRNFYYGSRNKRFAVFLVGVLLHIDGFYNIFDCVDINCVTEELRVEREGFVIDVRNEGIKLWGGGEKIEARASSPCSRVSSWRPALRASPSRGFFCNQGVATP